MGERRCAYVGERRCAYVGERRCAYVGERRCAFVGERRCAYVGERRCAFRNLVEKAEGERPLGKPSPKREDSMETDLKGIR